ncbi:MAG TPA: FHA domain-containing protein [Aggregicoccus sp.]|nr:FHA domain-containing protein [Aggregicoccus sp.]
MGFQLTIAEGQEAGRELQFEQDEVLFGRADTCDVVLRDAGVSRRHCRIVREGGRYLLEDLGSANGTLVNDAPVQRAQLAGGDTLALGEALFVFAAAEPAPQADADSTRILARDTTRERPAPVRLTAAERARLRRQLSPALARARIFWLEATPNLRRALMGSAGALALGLVALLAWAVFGGGDSGARGREPDTLSARPLADSFGLGEGVTWERPDLKVFTWEYTAATRAVVLLHFQAQEVSEAEVMVTVNGVDVGRVPADRLNSQERALELRVPPELLKKGEPNRITFDNTRNPPGEDPWRVWNLWVETSLLPELPREQLVYAAREAYGRGEKSLEAADIGAGNRYAAWRAFREAWLLLEAHPEPRPSLHLEARDRVREAQAQLDRACSRLLLEVERDANLRDWKAAAASLEQFEAYFPAYDQPCRTRAERKRREYGL